MADEKYIPRPIRGTMAQDQRANTESIQLIIKPSRYYIFNEANKELVRKIPHTQSKNDTLSTIFKLAH